MADQDQHFAFGSSGSNESLPKLYSIFKGEIASVKDYGVFVKIPGCGRNQGLVHKSQMFTEKIDNPSDVAAVGDHVYCKVINIEDESKIALAMKLVNQTTGEDNDKNNVVLSQDAQRKKKFGGNKFKKIELQAELNTTCKKCGGRGHLKQDCFQTDGGKVYELLPDIDTMVEESLNKPKEKDGGKKKEKSKKKKKEKKKHKHKSKKRKHDSSSSDESDEKYHKKSSHKHKKRKKHRHRSSSSSSDSD